MRDSISIFNYEGNDVTFRLADGRIMVNATQMAKPFNKSAYRYFENPSTFEYVVAYLKRKLLKDNNPALCVVVENEVLSKISKHSNRGVIVNLEGLSELYPDIAMMSKGGNVGTQMSGIFLCEELALHFAQWLSADFHLWCNEQIKTLLNEGSVSLQPKSDDELILQAMNVLQKRIAIQKEQIRQLQPKANYYDSFMESENMLNIRDTANQLGIGEKVLVECLINSGFIYRQNGKLKAYRKYIEKDVFRLVDYKTPTGNSGTQLMITCKGKDVFYRMFVPSKQLNLNF